MGLKIIGNTLSNWFKPSWSDSTSVEGTLTTTSIPYFTGTNIVENPNGIVMTGLSANYINRWWKTELDYKDYSLEDLDTKPLFRYVKKTFPFVVDISSIDREISTIAFNTTTLLPERGNIFQVNVILTPTHFSEVFQDEELRLKLHRLMVEKLTDLIRCMYDNVRPEEIQFVFHPEKTETLLEYIKDC